MPVRPLPPSPDLAHLKHQAKDLLRLHASHNQPNSPAAAQRLREFHPRFRNLSDPDIFAAPLKLSDAQLTIARECGFQSWPRLRAHVLKPSPLSNCQLPHHERIADPDLRHAVDLLDAGDAEALRLHLTRHPGLARRRALFEGGNYFHTPTLLQFIAENPVRHNRLPANIVEIAEIILAAGVDPHDPNVTLVLVATGSVPEQSGHQIALIDLLCSAGADPNLALRPAALHGSHPAVHALLARGATLDLPVAAALNRLDHFRRLLPASRPEDRHLALALAAQFGHIEPARLLLDSGEDVNRYNPPGGHSHGTPLHQAVANGHVGMVHLLVDRGARLDIPDILWSGTPADWAAHMHRPDLEAFLRVRMPAAQSPATNP